VEVAAVTVDQVASQPVLELGVSARAFAGNPVSGDQYLVARFPEGLLVAVVDGLGHGPEAYSAAKAATTSLAQCAGQPLPDMLGSCHEALKKTRGAALSLGLFHTDRAALSWLGVGNVEAWLIRADGGLATGTAVESLLLRAGVVGYRLPPLRMSTLPLFAGDTLILATDGIKGLQPRTLAPQAEPQELAQSILSQHGKNNDDALVVVVRYQGPGVLP
jgi:serine phosphatase RsbU (regulator of sigma subunit)